MQISNLPQQFFVQLVRNHSHPETGIEKIKTKIHMPEKLVLNQPDSNPETYELKSIAIHLGEDAFGCFMNIAFQLIMNSPCLLEVLRDVNLTTLREILAI